MKTVIRKLFKHGGSYAVDIPIEFIRNAGTKEVVIESMSPNKISIRPKTELDTIEAEPLFGEFIHALVENSMKHPEKLHDAKEVWDKEWDELLEGITDSEE